MTQPRSLVAAALTALLLSALPLACARSVPGPRETLCPSAPRPGPEVEVRARGRGPALALVTREGDAQAGLAAVVLVDGGPEQSAALAAVVEARLQQRGFLGATAHPDRDDFRVRATVGSPARGGELAVALRAALSLPLVAQTPEIALAARRLAALRRHVLASPALASIASCTGELAVLATGPALDPQTAAGLAELEGARARASDAARITIGVTGPAAYADAIEAAWGADPWPARERVREAPVASPASAAPEVSAFADPARALDRAGVLFAQRTERADTAVFVANELARKDAALGARLHALPVPFRISEISGVARPEGGCVALTLESERAARPAEAAAALAAIVVRQELALLVAAGSRRAEAPAAGLSAEASFAVRSATDPRDAAERAALFAMSRPRVAPSSGSVVVALGASPAHADDLAAPLAARVVAQLDRLQQAWEAPMLEHRERVERGQGEVWVLLGTRCGTMAEREGDAGRTALALVAALASSDDDPSVTLEPWISPDGVGVLAHGGRAPGESARAAAARIGERAARALLGRPEVPADMGAPRASLLARLPDEGPGLPALTAALAPGHPSWLAPLGAAESITRTGREAMLLRWEALARSPMRVAVLANESAAQAEAAVAVIDRWIVRGGEAAPTCSPAEAPAATRPGAIVVTGSADYARALIGIPVSAQRTPGSVFAELTLAGLQGGWLAQALASVSLGAPADVRLIGGTVSAALVVELRGTEASVESGVGQVRALLARLRQGAAGPSDLERSQALRERWALEASLDPRRRLVDLFGEPTGGTSSTGTSPAALAPSLAAWRAWSAATLRDDQLVVVTVLPKH